MAYSILILVDGRTSKEEVTIEECRHEVTKAGELMNQLVERHSHNQAFLKGVLKFCDRLSKYQNQSSKLSSAFHCFGIDTHQSKKVTSNALLKKKLGKKIKVQPEAVKRRKSSCGSKNAIAKGMRKRQNPFDATEPSVKRAHSFSKNVQNNEAISKKAGRTMASKTKFLRPHTDEINIAKTEQ